MASGTSHDRGHGERDHDRKGDAVGHGAPQLTRPRATPSTHADDRAAEREDGDLHGHDVPQLAAVQAEHPEHGEIAAATSDRDGRGVG